METPQEVVTELRGTATVEEDHGEDLESPDGAGQEAEVSHCYSRNVNCSLFSTPGELPRSEVHPCPRFPLPSLQSELMCCYTKP